MLCATYWYHDGVVWLLILTRVHLDLSAFNFGEHVEALKCSAQIHRIYVHEAGEGALVIMQGCWWIRAVLIEKYKSTLRYFADRLRRHEVLVHITVLCRKVLNVLSVCGDYGCKELPHHVLVVAYSTSSFNRRVYHFKPRVLPSPSYSLLLFPYKFDP